DRGSLPVGLESLIETVGGCECDRMRVVERRGLAMDAPRQGNAFGYCFVLRGARGVGISAETLLPCPNDEALQTFFRITARMLTPECLSLIEQLLGPGHVTLQELDVGKLLARIRERHGIGIRP